MKNFLICGPSGVGKTTLIKKILKNLNLRAGGFYTEELREKGKRVGFKIITLNNQEGILAHIKIEGGIKKVGKYGVNIFDLENIGVKSLSQSLKNDDLIVIDEIGKMEIFSDNFKYKVIDCLDSDKFVLATIGISGDKFIYQIKERKDVSLLVISYKNRDSLLYEILSMISRERKI